MRLEREDFLTLDLAYIENEPFYKKEDILVLDSETDLSLAGNATPFVVATGFFTFNTRLIELFDSFSKDFVSVTHVNDSVVVIFQHNGLGESIIALVEIFDFCLQNNILIINQTLEYDMRGMFNQYPELTHIILDLYRNSQCTDLTIREKLIDIATGRSRGGNRKYSLDEYAAKYLDIVLYKKNIWRRNFGLLKHIPLSKWPYNAVEYLSSDVSYIMSIYFAQRLHQQNPTYIGTNASLWVDTSKDKFVLHDEYRQTRYDFALNCAASIGMFKNWAHIKTFYEECKANYLKLLKLKQSLGIIRCPSIPSYELFVEALEELSQIEESVKLIDPSRYEPMFEELRKIYIQESYDSSTSFKNFGSRRGSAYEHVIGYAYYLTDKTPITTASGESLSTAEDDLKSIGDALINCLISANFHAYALSSIIPAVFKPTQIMTSRVDAIKETGRLSWKKTSQDGINFTGIARRYGPRQCFCAMPGDTMDTSDYGSLELCAISQVQKKHLGSSKLGDFINKGMEPSERSKSPEDQGDAHIAASCAIRHKDLEETLAIYTSHDPSLKTLQKEIKEERQVGKMINFGVWGGMGPEKLAISGLDYNVHVTKEEAKAIIDIVKEQFPEYVPYFQWIGGMLTLGFAQSKEGRKYKVGFAQLDVSKRIRQGGYTELANYWFQGTAADGSKAAFFEFFYQCFTNKDLKGCKPQLMIHDEFLSSGPKKTVGIWSEIKTDIMFEVMKYFLPECPSSVDPAVCFVWDKNAKEVRKEGIIVPCDKEPEYFV